MAEIINITPIPLPQTREEQSAKFASVLAKLDVPQLELLELVARALGYIAAAEAPDSPDADLIRQCDRLHACQMAIDAAYEVIPQDDKKRAIIIDPIHEKWVKAKDEIMELEGPTTPEGARAVAFVLLDQYPDGLEEAIKDDNLQTWLAICCAEYIVREPDEVGFGT
jgi:hypothetical protein